MCGIHKVVVHLMHEGAVAAGWAGICNDSRPPFPPSHPLTDFARKSYRLTHPMPMQEVDETGTGIHSFHPGTAERANILRTLDPRTPQPRENLWCLSTAENSLEGLPRTPQ